MSTYDVGLALPDWRNQKASTRADTILSFGKPSYTASEASNLFGVDRPEKLSERKTKLDFAV